MEYSAYQIGQIVGFLVAGALALGLLAFCIFSIVKSSKRPKGKKAAWIVSASISGALLLLTPLIIFGVLVMKQVKEGSSPSTLKTYSSADNTFTVMAPKSWTTEKSLVPDAQMQLSNRWAEQYFVVITESKASLGMTLEEVDRLTIENIAAENKFTPTEAELVTINGLPGRQHRFDTSEGITKVSHVRTVLESKTNFYYINSWTLASKAKANSALFDQVLASLNTTDGPPEADESFTMVPVPDAEEKVHAILVDLLGLESSQLTPQTTLSELGADELDSVEIVMALEEEFNLLIEDEIAEQLLTVGDIVSYVKAHARIPANLPEIPALPKLVLLNPHFSGGKGEEFEAGSAFLCEVAPGDVRLLTAHHLFGPAGGLEEDLTWLSLTKQYPKVTATLANSDELVATGNVTPVPGAVSMENGICAKDLAAYRISGTPQADVLPLANNPPAVGDIVFLNSPYVGWTAAVVTQVDQNNLVYRFFLPNTQLPGTSGAPVVNQQGEVVALNVGGREGKITIGMGNPCHSIKKLLKLDK